MKKRELKDLKFKKHVESHVYEVVSLETLGMSFVSLPRIWNVIKWTLRKSIWFYDDGVMQ